MEGVETKSYEISFLLKDEAAVADLLRALKEAGVEIRFEGPLRRIGLAYSIQKEHQAHFGYFHFESSPEKIHQLARELTMNPKVLRFLIVSPPFVKLASVLAAHPARDLAGEKRSLPSKAPLPLSNEELEKKIDEILQ